MKLAQYKGHTYDIPLIKNFFGYKIDYFKKYGLATDAVEYQQVNFANSREYGAKNFSEFEDATGELMGEFWFNPLYKNVPTAGYNCTTYHNYMDKPIPGSTDDEDPEYMIEYTYMVDNATDEIIWIQCSSEE